MFRMGWRAVIGFAGISVPNYAHANRLCSKIKLKPISLGEGSIEIAFDSSGLTYIRQMVLQQKTELGRVNEIIIKMNLIASYGKAQYSC